MNTTLLTTEGARQWADQHVRRALKIVAIGFASVTAFAIIAMFVRASMVVDQLSLESLSNVVIIGKRGGVPIRFFPSIGLSVVGLAAFFAAFGVWFVRPKIQIAKQVRTILDRATRIEGIVSATTVSSGKHGHTPFTKLEVVVSANDGRSYRATREELNGSPVPEVEQYAPAAVWVNARGETVVATGSDLFVNAAA